MIRLAYYIRLFREDTQGTIATTLTIVGIAILLGGIVAVRQLVDTGTQSLTPQAQLPPHEQCNDGNDFGFDPTKFGYTCTESRCVPDECTSQSTMREGYCIGGDGTIALWPVTCGSGRYCKEGECIVDASTPPELPPQPFCTDTDQGRNPHVVGTTCSINGCQSDTCQTAGSVLELSCNRETLISGPIPCIGQTCQNGKCVDAPSSTPIPIDPLECVSLGGLIYDYPNVEPGGTGYDFFATTAGGALPLTGNWSMVTTGQTPVEVGAFTSFNSATQPNIVPITWDAPAEFPLGTEGVLLSVTIMDASGLTTTCTNNYTVPAPPPNSCGADPADIVIAIDRSGSMGKQQATIGAETKLLLEWEKDAARILVDALAYLPGVENNIRFSVIDWAGNSDTLGSNGQLTNDYASVKDYIAGIQYTETDDHTCVQCAVRKSGQILSVPSSFDTVQGHKKVVVMMSDGISNRQWGSTANVEPTGIPTCTQLFPIFGLSCPEADKLAISEALDWKQQNTLFHILGYGNNASSPPTILEENLKNIASSPTATYYHYSNEQANWDNIFVDIATEICPAVATIQGALRKDYPSLNVTKGGYISPTLAEPLCSYPDANNITCPNDPPSEDLYRDLAYLLNVLNGNSTMPYNPARPDLDKNGDQSIDQSDVVILIGLVTGELDALNIANLNTSYR
jgi:hypothetical protein